MLKWSPIFETKIELLDTQHKNLIAMANALVDDITV